MDIQITAIVTRLDDALALYDEPVWRELRNALMAEKPVPSSVEISKEWYKAHPERLSKERAVLTKLLTSLPDCPTLFFAKADRLGATGLLKMIGGKQIKIEILYPKDYPVSPPRIFFFGPAFRKIPQLLREDGSVPVPFGAAQQWTEGCNSGIALNWAIEWLEQTMKLQAPQSPGGAPEGRRRT